MQFERYLKILRHLRVREQLGLIVVKKYIRFAKNTTEIGQEKNKKKFKKQHFMLLRFLKTSKSCGYILAKKAKKARTY